MRGTSSSRAACAAFAVAAVLAAALPACGTVDTLKTKVASDPETTARNAAPDDPQARAMQVGWTSARASYCGFIFDPAQLRASYLASEARAGKSPEEIAKLERAYDYTRDSVTASIKSNLAYCNKERTNAIRRDLNRYLAGDYTPSARMGR
ncbi:MAG TPA: hypothetical protein VEW64_06205 [Methyloceanibacter sp.]|jgi:Xaa-Pro aminopeptidase|nr:hypothetical protein [Methyloceanibacter sp.]